MDDALLRRYERYAGKWLAETESAEPPVFREPTDESLAEILSHQHITRAAKPEEYPAIREAIDRLRNRKMMTDELRELALFAYECGLVGSVGDVRHGATIRDGLARGCQAADELVRANVELHHLRKQVDLMAKALQRSAHDDRETLIAASLEQDKVDAFSVCTCNAEDETKCSRCGQCSRCHGPCDCPSA